MDLHPLPNHAVNHANKNNDAEVGVVPTVDEECFQRCTGISSRWGYSLDDGFKQVGDSGSGLGGDVQCVSSIDADHLLDLLGDPVKVRGRQVDLVQDRYDFMPGINGKVSVGKCLRLDTWLASTTRREPSTARMERETS